MTLDDLDKDDLSANDSMTQKENEEEENKEFQGLKETQGNFRYQRRTSYITMPSFGKIESKDTNEIIEEEAFRPNDSVDNDTYEEHNSYIQLLDTSANAGKLLDAANDDYWHDGIGQNNLTSQLNKERLDNEIRSSPEEEFFSLSCLALKIKLIEQL